MGETTEIEIGVKEGKKMIDFTLSIYKPKRKLCEYCGERKAKVVIINPNKFPNNDIRKKEDRWDVCKECRDIVNEQYTMSLKVFLGGDKDKILTELGYKKVEEGGMK